VHPFIAAVCRAAAFALTCVLELLNGNGQSPSGLCWMRWGVIRELAAQVRQTVAAGNTAHVDDINAVC
jgi:hypothetical protein